MTEHDVIAPAGVRMVEYDRTNLSAVRMRPPKGQPSSLFGLADPDISIYREAKTE